MIFLLKWVRPLPALVKDDKNSNSLNAVMGQKKWKIWRSSPIKEELNDG